MITLIVQGSDLLESQDQDISFEQKLSVLKQNKQGKCWIMQAKKTCMTSLLNLSIHYTSGT
jgi:hypothetical protein